MFDEVRFQLFPGKPRRHLSQHGSKMIQAHDGGVIVQRRDAKRFSSRDGNRFVSESSRGEGNWRRRRPDADSAPGCDDPRSGQQDRHA
jgi:hypothetical protein